MWMIRISMMKMKYKARKNSVRKYDKIILSQKVINPLKYLKIINL